MMASMVINMMIIMFDDLYCVVPGLTQAAAQVFAPRAKGATTAQAI
jgi:hypothetical protein